MWTYIKSAWVIFQVLYFLKSLTFKKFKLRTNTRDIIYKKVLIAAQIPNVSWRCFIWIVSYICDSLFEFYHFGHLLLRLISVSSQQFTQINHKLEISWQCLKISRNIFHSERESDTENLQLDKTGNLKQWAQLGFIIMIFINLWTPNFCH